MRLEEGVKVGTCKVLGAKKPVLYYGSEGEPARVLENGCDITGALPRHMRKPDMGRSPDGSETLNINSSSTRSFVPPA